jgi:hypothetical protein
MKLDVRAFALSCALIWGFGLLIVTLWIVMFEGQAAPDGPPPFLGLIYRGYRLTLPGAFIGLAWAFADGLIGGAILAWLYNLLRRKAPA